MMLRRAKFAAAFLAISVLHSEAQIWLDDAYAATVLVDTAFRQGSGIIVGEDPNAVYIATAAHVIETGDGAARSISIRFFRNPHIEIEAELARPDTVTLDADLAALRVEKSDLFEVPVSMPTLGRVSDKEIPERVRLVGHREGNFAAPPFAEVVSSGPNRFNAYTFDPREGFSGGGAFDSAGRLAGITLEGSNADASHGGGVVTEILPMKIVREWLRHWGIPMAPYLDSPQGALPESMRSSLAVVGGHVLRITEPQLSLYAVNEGVRTLEEGRLFVLVKTGSEWSIWFDEQFTLQPGQSVSRELGVPSETEAVFACNSNRLREGLYGYYTNATGNGLAEAIRPRPVSTLANRTLELIDLGSLIEQEAQLTAVANPCRAIIEEMTASTEEPLDATAHAELQFLINEGYILPRIGTLNLGRHERRFMSRPVIVSTRLYAEFAGPLDYMNLLEDDAFKIWLFFEQRDGRLHTATLTNADEQYLNLAKEVAIDPSYIIRLTSCSTRPLPSGAIAALRQSYEQGAVDGALGDATHSIATTQSFRAIAYTGGSEIRFGKTDADACGFEGAAVSPPRTNSSDVVSVPGHRPE